MRNINKSTFPPVCTQVVIELQGHNKLQIFLGVDPCTHLVAREFKRNCVLHNKVFLKPFLWSSSYWLLTTTFKDDDQKAPVTSHENSQMTFEWTLDLGKATDGFAWQPDETSLKFANAPSTHWWPLHHQSCQPSAVFFFFFSIDLLRLRLISLGYQ